MSEPAPAPSQPIYEERAFEHAEDLLQALAPTGVLSRQFDFVEQTWIFRGQGDARWGLCPCAFRPHALRAVKVHTDKRNVESPQDHAEAELEAVLRFALMADRAGFLLPGDAPAIRDPRLRRAWVDLLRFPPTEFLQVTALAQHYGVPTRLLDWTTKPLVAAYFAAWDCIQFHKNGGTGRTDLAVWALSSTFVQSVGPTRDPAFYALTAPSATNPNLHAQGGAFTLVQPRSQETAARALPNLDELILGIEPGSLRAPGRLPAFVKFTLPVREARVFVRLLGESGVSAATIFPGLAGVARAFFERGDWQWADRDERSV